MAPVKRSRFDVMPHEKALFEAASKRCAAIEATANVPKDSRNRAPTTLWMGDLERWEDEAHLWASISQLLPKASRLVSLKIVRDAHTAYHLGYGFLDFGSHEAAADALEILKRSSRPGHNRKYKVSWAASNTYRSSRPSDVHSKRPLDEEDALTVHVGCLDREIGDDQLAEFLKALGYRSVMHVKVARAENGESRGFAFIRFSSRTEFDDALVRLHGAALGTRCLQAAVAHRSERIVDRGASRSRLPQLEQPSEQLATNDAAQNNDALLSFGPFQGNTAAVASISIVEGWNPFQQESADCAPHGASAYEITSARALQQVMGEVQTRAAPTCRGDCFGRCLLALKGFPLHEDELPAKQLTAGDHKFLNSLFFVADPFEYCFGKT